MAVKIFIKRKVAEEKVMALTVLLKELRALTLSQPGYIFGETLRRIDAPDECMVISTWRSLEDWQEWIDNENRKEIQEKIDLLLGEKQNMPFTTSDDAVKLRQQKQHNHLQVQR